jgi:hypothetical protein
MFNVRRRILSPTKAPVARYGRGVPARILLVLTVTVAVLVSAAPAQAAKDKNWATVNICDTAKAPDFIGLRGAMPGLAHRSSVMYMRFRVQYRTSAKAWKVVPNIDTHFLRIGTGRSGRAAGHSFKIGTTKGAKYTLRGLVNFQWRATKGGKLLKATGRVTTAGHRGTVGADPKGFSAATCVIKG